MSQYLLRIKYLLLNRYISFQNSKERTKVNDSSDSKSIQNANDFLENMDELSFDKLKDLADNGSIESKEKLEELAEKYDINISDGSSLHDIAMKIYMAIEKDADNKRRS